LIVNQDLSDIATGNRFLGKPSYVDPASTITRGNTSGDDDIWVLQGSTLSTQSLRSDDGGYLMPYTLMGDAATPPVPETRPEWRPLALVERETVIGAETIKRPLLKAPSIHTLTGSPYDFIYDGAINLLRNINSIKLSSE